jgi:hypothetical protein
MSKTFITNAIGFVGSQCAILLAGAIISLVLCWDAKFAADVTVEAEMLFAGFAIRGWIA